MQIINSRFDKTSKTYATYSRAVAAAIEVIGDRESSLGQFFVTIASVQGDRFAPVFHLTEEQVTFCGVYLAQNGFHVVRV